MKRKIAWMGAIAGIGVIAAVLFNSSPDRVTFTNWKRIKLGMTAHEVEAILGPAGLTVDEFDEKLWQLNKIAQLDVECHPKSGDGTVPIEGPWQNFNSLTGLTPANVEQIERTLACERDWIGSGGGIALVRYDENNRVESTRFMQWRLAEPSMLNKIRVWLRR